jgi:hypothetical protein
VLEALLESIGFAITERRYQRRAYAAITAERPA